MKKLRKKRNKLLQWVAYVLVGTLLIFSVALKSICQWSVVYFNVSLEEILFTITSPLKGTESNIVLQAVEFCIPKVCPVIIIYLCMVIIDVWNSVKLKIKIYNKRFKIEFEVVRLVRWIVVVFTFISLYNTFDYANREYDLVKYIKNRLANSQIYEEYYVKPSDIDISPKGEKKNLICIYLESMETTYASVEDGGQQPETYIPNLIELTKEGVSFSHTDGFGGFSSITGTYWTMAGLLATTSGVPFSFPVEANSMGEREVFAGGLTTLGDILEEQGYRQMFMCGSDAEFGGRKQYFEQHGNYEIFDLHTAKEEGYLAEDYYKWWGFEDKYLFDFAKKKLIEISAESEPFNFTMLTVDTHPVGGFVCDWCEQTYENDTANVVACTDRQVYEFVEWCKKQNFYEDTVIVLVGDHLRMDTHLLENADHSNRRVYNCFINSFAEISDQSITKERIFTTVDIFPTILAAMGFEFDGERIGLGTNMFSGEKTLAEQLGYETFNNELEKHSQFYLENFQ